MLFGRIMAGCNTMEASARTYERGGEKRWARQIATIMNGRRRVSRRSSLAAWVIQAP